MIKAPQLLADLTKLLKRLEGDLLQRIEETPDLKASLQAEWQAARDADRCAETFETWADQVITQAGVHWLLSCVFLRFIEDNQLVDRPWLGGTPESGRLALVRDRHEAYFQAHPLHSDRDYLLAAFREAGTLPGLHTFFDEAHNPAFRLGISGDAAMALRQFWQQVDPNTGGLLHDFTDPAWNTRFLGDLYQDLSEAARKRYALLQTPEFVEEFILDRTLTPAIREFGFREVRMIDPTCGSGHFLLGGFYRVLAEWQRHAPGHNPVDMAQKALDAVAGVDLNPFAVAISRFRLFVAALQASGVQRLANAHDFQVHVAIGDSLLHGTRFGLTKSQELFDVGQSYVDTGLAHAYATEDLNKVQRILSRQYHAVVGNPPYIVVADAVLNARYRSSYASCHKQYSLGVVFTEKFFELALRGVNSNSAGFVGLITANTFMKRDFGEKLIEKVLPSLDLTHVVDTSGAYIPGHGTPTVIILGRNQAPLGGSVRVVRGLNGEPETPTVPRDGKVWSSIVSLIDFPGEQTKFIGVDDTSRADLSIHPWNIGGGPSVALSEVIEGAARTRLREIGEVLGGTGRTSADDAFIAPERVFRQRGIDGQLSRPLVEGDQVRHWMIYPKNHILTPYDPNGILGFDDTTGLARWLWPMRTTLGNRVTFSKKTYFEEGRPWWGWHQINVGRLSYERLIAFPFQSTHATFSIDRGGKVFKQTALFIRLNTGSNDDDYAKVLGNLNSSVGCFWLKQFCFNRGDSTDSQGARTTGDPSFDTYEFGAGQVENFPLVGDIPISLVRRMIALADEVMQLGCSRVLFSAFGEQEIAASLINAQDVYERSIREMISLQEELDWFNYQSYGLVDRSLTCVDPDFISAGQRAFEIRLARRMKSGHEQSSWFERNGIKATTEISSEWKEDYKRVVQSRLDAIEHDERLALLERPEFKRRWNVPSWKEVERDAMRQWLLARLEIADYWPASANQPPQLTSTSRLADAVSRDTAFMQIAPLYAGHTDFDLAELVAELVAGESVPALPIQRYSDTGLRKRAQWQDTWGLQRREDAGDVVSKIPVPPKYQSKDFLKADFWRLRGGLDVPKERWVSYPGCERGADGSLVIAWAGWNHLQQATAVASYYMDMKDGEGWEPSRLQPLLAALLELVPWLEQWHNEIDPVFGERMGHYYKGFVTEEARALGFTLDDLRAWKPAPVAAKRGRKKKDTT